MKEIILFLSSYFFLATILLIVKLSMTSAWFDGTLEANHELLMQFSYLNNEQSRLFQFGIPELLRIIFNLSVVNAYILQRWVFTWATLMCFHTYLRRWFPPLTSFAGVCFLCAVMPLSFVIRDLMENAPLLCLTFLLGLWAMREKKDVLFAFIILVGAINNEAMLSLTAAHFFISYKGWTAKDILRTGLRTIAVTAPAWIALFLIHARTYHIPHLGGDWIILTKNFMHVFIHMTYSPFQWYKATFLFIFFLYGALWNYAYLGYDRSDQFLRRASLFIPLFIASYLVTGVISEVRQMLPLAFLIIPLAFRYLGDVLQDCTKDSNKAKIADGPG